MPVQVLSVADAAVLSGAIDDGMLSCRLKLTEVLLLLILKRETVRRGVLSAPVRLGDWSKELGMDFRKLRVFFLELVALQIVDFNEGQGTYRLRPDVRKWSQLRGSRARTQQRDAVQELPLTAERPLDDALSDLATESALAGGPEALGPASRGWDQLTHEDFEILRGAATGGVETFSGSPAENSAGGAEKLSGGAAENSAGAKRPEKQPVSRAAENSAGPLKLASSFVQEKLASSRAAENSAGQAMEWLRSIDSSRALNVPAVLAQWEELCYREPRYVLGPLKQRWDNRQDKNKTSPLGWLACQAFDAKKLRRLGRR